MSKHRHPTEPLTSDRERTILQAARRRFAYYGFSKVTMEEIASDVPMAKASLYYYYPTKETLLESVLAHEKDQFFAEIRIVLTKPISAGDKLKRYVRKRAELFRELVNLSALTFSKIARMNEGFARLIAELEEEEVKLVLDILREGRRSGEFSVSNLRQTAELIPHTLQGLRIRAIRKAPGSRPTGELFEAIRREGELLIDHLLQGIQR
jgi:TetR/AcrR family transcriptional regulator